MFRFDETACARGNKHAIERPQTVFKWPASYAVPRNSMGDSAARRLRSIVSENDDEHRFDPRLPRTLSDVLAASGCHLFLEAMRKASRLRGANSITILAPNDNAFHSGMKGGLPG